MTGVQTCALPICDGDVVVRSRGAIIDDVIAKILMSQTRILKRRSDESWEIGRASCRERV